MKVNNYATYAEILSEENSALKKGNTVCLRVCCRPDEADSWSDCDISEYVPTPIAKEQRYTEEELLSMSADELRSICAELGISGSMTKANMIGLILAKQSKELNI